MFTLNFLSFCRTVCGVCVHSTRLYKHAIQLEPNFPDAFNNLGNAYREVPVSTHHSRHEPSCFVCVSAWMPARQYRCLCQCNLCECLRVCVCFHACVYLCEIVYVSIFVWVYVYPCDFMCECVCIHVIVCVFVCYSVEGFRPINAMLSHRPAIEARPSPCL